MESSWQRRNAEAIRARAPKYVGSMGGKKPLPDPGQGSAGTPADTGDTYEGTNPSGASSGIINRATPSWSRGSSGGGMLTPPPTYAKGALRDARRAMKTKFAEPLASGAMDPRLMRRASFLQATGQNRQAEQLINKKYNIPNRPAPTGAPGPSAAGDAGTPMAEPPAPAAQPGVDTGMTARQTRRVQFLQNRGRGVGQLNKWSQR